MATNRERRRNAQFTQRVRKLRMELEARADQKPDFEALISRLEVIVRDAARRRLEDALGIVRKKGRPRREPLPPAQDSKKAKGRPPKLTPRDGPDPIRWTG